MTRLRWVPLALLLLVALLAGACSDSSSDNESADMPSAGDSGGEPAPVDDGDAGFGEQDGESSGGGSVTDLDVDLAGAEVDREIIYRGDIAAEVDDVVAAARAARDEVAAEGGFVFGQQISQETARVVLKVPAIRFEAAFDAVLGIGDVTDQSIEAEDVTDQFTDLESRLATLETSIERLRGFLAETTNVDEISRLESELTRREAERDVIAGQLRVLRDRTEFATISVVFTNPDPEEPEDDEDDGPPGFGEGLGAGWDAAVLIAGAVATAAGFILPFLPLVAALVGLGVWLRRRGAASARG